MRSPPAAAHSSGLEIRLFGFSEFRRDGCLLPPLATHKAQALLAYLIQNRAQPHSRDKLIALFWGDQDDAHARHSLATALWRIRRLFADDDAPSRKTIEGLCSKSERDGAPDYLLTDATSIQFNPHSPFWLDTAEFEKLIREPSTIPNLQAAIALYRGDFLEGFYDDWCLEERYRLEALYLATLSRLIHWCEEQRDATLTLEYAAKYLAHDALEDTIHLAAMRAFAALGDWASARHQWQSCCQTRYRDLHAPPSPEALRQAQAILGAQFFVPFPQAHTAIIMPRHRNALATLPFVGRACELDALLSRREQVAGSHADVARPSRENPRVMQGKGGVILIDGEAGIGKTRLVEELAAVIGWRGGVVARGRACQVAHPIPYAPLVEIVRGLLNAIPIEQVLPLWARGELARIVPEFDSSNVQERNGRTVRLMQAISALVGAVAARTPLLIVVEDLQWVNDSTLAAFDYLARRIPQTNTLIIGTFRPEEVDDQHPLMTLAAQLAREGLAHQLSLAPLSLKAVLELVQRVRGGDAEFAKQLYAHTEGNALFLIETLRELANTPGMTDLPIANTVRQLIGTRLARLDNSARELVAWAAVAGRAFDMDVICRAAGIDEETALTGIDELLARGFLREGTKVSGRDYEFVHALIHQVVYASLHHRRRVQLHRLIGEALEELTARRAEQSGILAHHFARANVPTKALAYAEQAARRAWNLGAAKETVQYYDLALQCLERVGVARSTREYRERRFDLLLGYEQALDVLAQRDEQVAAQAQLAELAETLNDDARRAQVHLRRFWYHYPQRLNEARVEAERALALAQQQQQRTLQVQASYALALALARSNEPARGLAYAEAALAQARELHDQFLEGWSLLQLGFIYKRLNDWERAHATLEQALSHNRKIENLLAVGRTLIHLGDVYRARGEHEQAQCHYRKALALARKTGYRWVEEDAQARLKA